MPAVVNVGVVRAAFGVVGEYTLDVFSAILNRSASDTEFPSRFCGDQFQLAVRVSHIDVSINYAVDVIFV